MNKDVLITISGLLFAGNGEDEKDGVDVIAPGQCYWKNGKHYLLYDEVAEEFSEPIHNVVKISPQEVVVRKRGMITTELDFTTSRDTTTHYSTPFGTLVMGIHTTKLCVEEVHESMKVDIEYSLEVNYEHVSDCFLKMLIQPKSAEGGFSLKS